MANRTVTWSPRHFDGSLFTGSVDISQGPVMLGSGSTTYVRDMKTYKLVNGNLSVSLMPTDLPEHSGVDWAYIFKPVLFDSSGSMVDGAVPFAVKVPSGTTSLSIDSQVPNDVVDSINIKYVKGEQGPSGRLVAGSLKVGPTGSLSLTDTSSGQRLDVTVPSSASATRVSTGIVKLTI